MKLMKDEECGIKVYNNNINYKLVSSIKYKIIILNT